MKNFLTGIGILLLFFGGSGIDSAPVMCGVIGIVGSLIIYGANRKEQYE